MLKFKKSLGQNFLIDQNIIKKITSLETIENQSIFEIGPGTGNLTSSIVNKRPKSITLIEKDKRFYDELKNKFQINKNYRIINDDILKYNLNAHNNENVIVFGNLPYNISTQILAKFIGVKRWPPFYSKMIFMFQKEVAERILAKKNTKQYSRISVLANFNLEIMNHFNISKRSFFPVPKVDSKIIVFKPRALNKYKISNIKNLEKITHVFFSQKRKMINKVFSKLFKNYKRVATDLNINLSSRPSELSCNDYYRITEYFENIK
tara:strand:+ start:263 stop:1054 length:792 start_codon:yes stop_codon:yes gene_type:complete